MLLLFNALFPMYPLDAARLLESGLSRSKPELRSQWITANTGIAVATVVGIIALVVRDATALFALCVVCGLICSMHRRRLQFLATAELIPGVQASAFRVESDEEVSSDRESIDPNEIDRILEKISQNGITSLSRKERRTLKRATETSRKPQ